MGLEYGFDRGMGCKLEKLPVPEKLLHLEIETCQGKKWYFLGHTNFVPKPTHPGHQGLFVKTVNTRIPYGQTLTCFVFKWCKAVDRRSTFPSSAWNLGGDLEFDLAFLFRCPPKTCLSAERLLKKTNYSEPIFFPNCGCLSFLFVALSFFLGQKKIIEELFDDYIRDWALAERWLWHTHGISCCIEAGDLAQEPTPFTQWVIGIHPEVGRV